jgi:hypothetical protein
LQTDFERIYTNIWPQNVPLDIVLFIYLYV